MFNKVIFVITILVTSLYVMPVTAQEACDGQVGAAYGLCNAYCEAMDCESDDPQASDKACDKVYDKFFVHTGTPPPCEVSCPCFTLDDLTAGGPILECGENFLEFPGVAGILYGESNKMTGLACSGDGCTGAPGSLSCASSVTGMFSTDISTNEEGGCRSLILLACDNPNDLSSDLAPSDSNSDGSVFTDQL